jgi:uncharacterized protein (TIGR02246 family)
MRRVIVVVVGLVAALVLGARMARADAAQDAAQDAAGDAVRAAVESGNRAFIAAFLRGDAKAVSELYTEDAQVIAPGMPVARGRAAIAATWQQAMDGEVKDLTLKTLDVESAGDLACETGTVGMVGRHGNTSARYVVVWKRINGQWKLHRDIWNAE